MISELAFLGILLIPCWLRLCLFWHSLVLGRRCRWRAVDKPAALQVTARSIFLPFLSFSLYPLVSSSALYTKLFLCCGSLTPWGCRDFLRQERSHFWVPSRCADWTISWPANLSNLCVVLMVDWSHLATVVNSYVHIRGLLKAEALQAVIGNMVLFNLQAFICSFWYPW